MAKSETNDFGFSIKSVIIFSLFTFTTPNALGSSTCLTQITPSDDESKVKSALNKVSANATTTGPFNDFSAWAIA